MSPEDLRVLTSLYARYVRLNELHVKLNRAGQAERYMLRTRLQEDFAFNPDAERPDPDTPSVA